MPKRILVDTSRCVGCRSCEIGCAVAHSNALELTGAVAEGAHPRVLVVNADGRSVPVQCRHCENAPCVAVCPKAALTQDGPEGAVMPHPELCTACRSCVTVCPFGAIRLAGADGKTLVKCDLCIDRLEAGQEPACVEACPTGAIVFAETEGEVAEAYNAAEARATEGELAGEPEAIEQPADAEGKRKPARVACAVCGEQFNPAALLKSAAKKLGRQPSCLVVCPRCRRVGFGEELSCRIPERETV